MKIQTYEEKFGKKLTVGDLFDSFYEDTKTGAVTGFGGKLNLRPKYQREFVYEIDKQAAVIDTILDDCPLNTMYWAATPDGFELMDGQQRSISICKFLAGAFSVKVNIGDKNIPRSFENLSKELKEKVLNYPLMVYICEGSEDDILKWFKKINIAGLKLTEQEMRNAIYNGPWVSDAKRYFSNLKGEGWLSEGHVSNGHVYGDYTKAEGGSKSEKETAVVRQKLLEIVLTWAVDAYNTEHQTQETIESYMDIHRNDANARELWRYYEDVMEWVKDTFPTYRPVMKTVEWGILYNKYKDTDVSNADEKANKIFKHIDEISNPKGIYEAVLSGDIKHLHARAFDKKDINKKYNEQKGVCPYCHGTFESDQMHGDHIVPWSKGGITEYTNLQLLCSECNIKKSSYDVGYTPWDEKEYKAFDILKWDNK